MATFRDFINSAKKVVKYTVPGAYTLDKAKDTAENATANYVSKPTSPFAPAQTQTGLPGTSPLTTDQPYYSSQYSTANYTNDGGDGYTNTGYGASSTSATPQASQLKNSISGILNGIHDVYNNLFGNIDKSYSEKAGQVNQQYDLQNSDLGNQFNNTLGQVQNIYGARGLSDSSYLGDKVGQVSKDYYNGLGQIGLNRQNSMAQLGQNLAATKAGLQNQLKSYDSAAQNLDQYSASDLQGLLSQLQQAQGSAQSTAQNYLTTPEYVSKLAEVNPIANPGTGALASQLQTLVTSSAPIFAKKEIAQGLIKRAQLTDPNAQSYWSNYFNDLLNKNGIA